MEQNNIAAMKNACTRTRTRTRQSDDFWNKPQFGLWMWCTVIKCLIRLPCILSSCQGVNISVALYPHGPINLRYGDPLELICVAENNFTAHDLEFSLLGGSIDSEIVNKTTRRLYIKHLEPQVLVYYCRNHVTRNLCFSRVLVDLPPSNTTDFSCISRNVEEFNCSWTPTHSISPINYSLAFMIHNRPWSPCAIITDGKKSWCSWNTIGRPRYKQMEHKFDLQLTSCNFFGCNQQTFTIDHYSSVKPDPPQNLKVVTSEPHSVLLSWRIPNNIVDFLGSAIVHRIEYRIAERNDAADFRQVDTSSLKSRANDKTSSNKKAYTWLLTQLPYAHKKYEVRLNIKPKNAVDRYWSDFSYLLFTTASERPQRPPDTIAGAFDQSIYNDKRVIYVYWQQLEKYEEAGANFTYKVVIKQSSKNPQTVQPDKNRSLSYVVLKDAPLEAIDVLVWSTNSVGLSFKSSNLYIPSIQDTNTTQIHSFTQVANEDGTYRLTWVGVGKIDNYTLFWCQHIAAKVCVGRIGFTVLEPGRHTHLIELPKENKYQFAISANGGPNSSGMVWTSCDISAYRLPIPLPQSSVCKP